MHNKFQIMNSAYTFIAIEKYGQVICKTMKYIRAYSVSRNTEFKLLLGTSNPYWSTNEPEIVLPHQFKNNVSFGKTLLNQY